MVMIMPHQLMPRKHVDMRNGVQNYAMESLQSYDSQWLLRKQFLERKNRLKIWENKYRWIIPEEEKKKVEDIESDYPVLEYHTFDSSWCYTEPHNDMDRQYYKEWIQYWERKEQDSILIRGGEGPLGGGYRWLLDCYFFNNDTTLVWLPTYINAKVHKDTGILYTYKSPGEGEMIS
jgi:hypothetical protein